MTSLGQSICGWCPTPASSSDDCRCLLWLCCYVSTKQRGKILFLTTDTCRNDVPIDQGVCLSGVWGLCLFTRATHVLLAALSLLCFILQLITQTTLTWLFSSSRRCCICRSATGFPSVCGIPLALSITHECVINCCTCRPIYWYFVSC